VGEPLRRRRQPMAGLPASTARAEDIGTEVDVAVSFAVHAWKYRTGGAACHDVNLRPRTVRVTVGNAQVFVKAPEPQCLDTPAIATFSRPSTVSVRLGSKEDSALVAGGRASLAMASQRNAPPEKPPPTPRRHPYIEHATLGDPEEFLVSDFVLMESPTLADMYWSQGAGSTLGPVRRSAVLFPAVLGVLKLRWLVRLDAAVRELCSDGPTASVAGFHRLLECFVDILCGFQDCAYSPIQAYNLCIEALRAQFGATAWPLFLAYVNTHDRGVSRNAVGGLPSVSNPSTSMSSPASQACWRATDDTFVAWLSRQDGLLLTASDVMEEFDYYGVPAPVVRTSFPNLMAWSTATYTTRHRFVREARLESAHLAVLLEMPSLRSKWTLDPEETLHIVREICANPRTFSTRIRSRLYHSLLRVPRGPLKIPENMLAKEATEEQLREVWSATTGPSDAGGLTNMALEAMRDKHPPWLVGGEVVSSRFKRAPSAKLPSHPLSARAASALSGRFDASRSVLSASAARA